MDLSSLPNTTIVDRSQISADKEDTLIFGFTGFTDPLSELFIIKNKGSYVHLNEILPNKKDLASQEFCLPDVFQKCSISPLTESPTESFVLFSSCSSISYLFSQELHILFFYYPSQTTSLGFASNFTIESVFLRKPYSINRGVGITRYQVLKHLLLVDSSLLNTFISFTNR